MPLDVNGCCEGAEGQLAQLACDYIALRGADHADRKVGISGKKVGDLVARHDVEHDARIAPGQTHGEGRQKVSGTTRLAVTRTSPIGFLRCPVAMRSRASASRSIASARSSRAAPPLSVPCHCARARTTSHPVGVRAHQDGGRAWVGRSERSRSARQRARPRDCGEGAHAVPVDEQIIHF